MKRYFVNVTLRFKRSGDEMTNEETYLIPNKMDIKEAATKWHKENGNHEVINVEVLGVKKTSYKTRSCKLIA